MPLTLGAASLIGSGISSAANLISNEIAYRRQMQLDDYKYRNLIDFAKSQGATPSALVSGVTGAAGQMPQVSNSNNPFGDLGQVMTNAVSAKAAEGNAQAAMTNAETERNLALMKLKFEPMKYFADIRRSLAEAFESSKHAFLHGSMKTYYDELTKDVQQVRPWKLASLRQGLLNDMAKFGQILQETNTSKAQEGYYKSASHELETRSDMNEANTSFIYSQSLNESLRGYRLQFENTLLSYGIDPNKPFWQNSLNLMSSQPKLFVERMDMFISALNSVDNRIQENLGEHYKETIATGLGLYKLNQYHQKNANNRAWRNNMAIGTISKLIPYLSGLKGLSGASSQPLMPWGDFWQSDTYKNRWNTFLNE